MTPKEAAMEAARTGVWANFWTVNTALEGVLQLLLPHVLVIKIHDRKYEGYATASEVFNENHLSVVKFMVHARGCYLEYMYNKFVSRVLCTSKRDF